MHTRSHVCVRLLLIAVAVFTCTSILGGAVAFADTSDASPLVLSTDPQRPPTEEDVATLDASRPVSLTLRVPRGNPYSDPDPGVPAPDDLDGYEITLHRLSGIDLRGMTSQEWSVLTRLVVGDTEPFGGTRAVELVGTRTTGIDGEVTFEDLSPGVHLVVIRDTVVPTSSRVRWLFEPMLVMVPVWNGSAWEPSVTANLKGVPSTPVSPPDVPPVPETPGTPPPVEVPLLPVTGARVGGALIGAAIVLAAGVVLNVFAARRAGRCSGEAG